MKNLFCCIPIFCKIFQGCQLQVPDHNQRKIPELLDKSTNTEIYKQVSYSKNDCSWDSDDLTEVSNLSFR